MCIKRCITLFLLSFIISVGFMLGAERLGASNVWEDSVTGEGAIDHRSYTADNSVHDVAMVENGSAISYWNKRTWAEGTAQSFESSFMVTAGPSPSKYRNQYRVTVKSAGYTHHYEANKIMGDFTGSANFVTAETTLDSLIIMDGNATFKARMVNGQGKHPVTEKEVDDVGRLILRQYLNISNPEKQPEDWLAFCNEYNVTKVTEGER